MNKEILHKKGCYSMFYDDNGRCVRCKVLFADKKKWLDEHEREGDKKG